MLHNKVLHLIVNAENVKINRKKVLLCPWGIEIISLQKKDVLE